MRPVRLIVLFACLMLLMQGAARAQRQYTIQALVGGGSRAGDFVVSECGGECYDLGGLNDAGQAVIYAHGEAGGRALVEAGPSGLSPIVQTGGTLQGVPIASLVSGFLGPSQSGHTLFMAQDSSGNTVLAQHAAGTGKVTVMAAVGASAPGGGRWSYLPTPIYPETLIMNDHGNAVFYGFVKGGTLNSSTFRWDSQAQALTPVVVAGMKAGDITLDGDLSYYGPAINNQDELLVGGPGKDGAGNSVQGLFFLDRKQNLLPVAVIGQRLPDGDQLENVSTVAVNDLGTVSFVGERMSDHKNAVYLWTGGTVSATGIAEGGAAPLGGKFTEIAGLRLNNVNSNLLVAAGLDNPAGRGGLFLFANGKLQAVSTPGQPLPDGSTSAGFIVSLVVSRANAAGEIAFVTSQSDGAALYLLEPDGRLSQVLKTGAMTSLGAVSMYDFADTVGFADGIGLNGKGQIALPVTFESGFDQTQVVALLTPAG